MHNPARTNFFYQLISFYMKFYPLLSGLFILFLISCGESQQDKKEAHAGEDTTVATNAQPLNLPAPFATPSANAFSEVIGWPEGKTPVVPAGFTVSKFADSLDNPRWAYVANNGDIFVAESATNQGGSKKVTNAVTGKSKSQNYGSANRITLFRDTNGDGIPEMRSVFLTDLNQPFGMLIIGNKFYVANTDGIVAFPYSYGQTKMNGKGTKIMTLPAGGYNNHWTRNIITNSDSSKIYVAVGSASNVAEHGMKEEERRACILEINPDGTGEKIYASGLRNPIGMDWAPGTQTLFTSVNERDGLGDDLVPDYLTSVQPGGFYGWPYSYFGKNEDPRMKDQQKPELVAKAIVPDVPLGSHTASLGLAFDKSNVMSGKYAGGAFIGQHGSWNRSKLSGYQVAFVPFKNGKPAGSYEPFMTGFIADSAAMKVYGRPVGVAFTPQGHLLVTDDSANTIWIVKKG